MRHIIYITFFLSIFSFIDLGILESPQILIQHPLIIVSLIYCIYKYKNLPIDIITIYFVLFVIGSFNVVLGNNSWGLLFKISIGLIANTLFFYYLIKHECFNTYRIFKAYMYGALASSIIVIIQIISYGFGFRYGYDVELIGIRLSIEDGEILPASLFTEPSHYASVLSPAIFISIYNIISLKKHFVNLLSSAIILLSTILIYSSTGYIAILLSLILIAVNYRKIKVLISVLCIGIICFYLLYNNVSKFKVRVDDSKSVFFDNKVKLGQNKEYNASTMVLYNNMIIAFKNFSQHPIFGTGLGSHIYAHDKYTIFKDDVWWVNLNKEDANSLFLRIISELGLIGIFFTFYFINKFRISKEKSNNDTNWLINNAILVLFIVNLLRQGNYMIYGFTCFVLLYYFSSKQNNSKLTENLFFE